MNYLLQALVILTSLPLMECALQCYQCQVLADIKCRDPFSDEAKSLFAGDCDDGMVCAKYTTVVKIRDSGYIQGWERHSKVVTRSCEQKTGKPDGCYGWQNNGGITIKCHCSTELCNSGHSLHPATWKVVISFFLSLFLFIFVRLH
ncbi:unnamed protein product [Lymnaea stagnalis]|uniref:Protein quiver n=1 Tax=Lymnaea stagnalis TaxID=6523 RepID=A0AAV2IQ26_LYMST